MASNFTKASVQNQYLEAEILSADPVKLVSLAYRGALDAVAAARRHLANREIRERSTRLMQTYGILFELSRALDYTAGGEISRNLGKLYFYMQNRLLEANSQQSDEPLAEVERLLTTLNDGWKTVPAMHTTTARAPVAASEEYTPMSYTG